MDRPQFVLRYAAVAGIAVLAVAPWMVSLYKVHVLNILIINIIMATSLNLIMGYAGQFAKANVAFMGLGAYTMGVLVTRADWSFWIAWPTGALLAAGVGTLVALPRCGSGASTSRSSPSRSCSRVFTSIPTSPPASPATRTP